MTQDGELLRRYAEEGSEESFAELVTRHANYVHLVAMRRGNRNRELAADVTQIVFTALAQNARTLATHTAISGWLYATTRNAVLDSIRDERRRLEREQEAMLMYENDNSSEELIDNRLFDAVDKLNDRDREAVSMRFFNEWSFSRIAESMRITEDAARMRVDRALLKLRATLARRGVSSTAAALATSLANNAGLGAPADLTAQITQIALAAGPAAPLAWGGILTLIADAKATLMLTGTGLLLLLGTAEYQRAQSDLLSNSLAEVLVERTSLMARLQSLRDETQSQDPATASLAAQLAAVPSASPIATATQTPTTEDYVAILRAKLESMPEKQIPEIQLLNGRSWNMTVEKYPPIENEVFPTAFNVLRDYARTRFATYAMDALSKYAAKNGGALPNQMMDLAPYFDEPISPEILSRYAILRRGSYADAASSTPLIGETKGVIDDFGDSVLRFGKSVQSLKMLQGNGFEVRVFRAIHIYMSTHNGEMPSSEDDLRPFFPPDELLAAKAKLNSIR